MSAGEGPAEPPPRCEVCGAAAVVLLARRGAEGLAEHPYCAAHAAAELQRAGR